MAYCYSTCKYLITDLNRGNIERGRGTKKVAKKQLTRLMRRNWKKQVEEKGVEAFDVMFVSDVEWV